MKKIAIMALLSVAALAASAQTSTMNIYGIIDMGVVKSNGGTADGSNSTNSAWRVQSATQSRLGFRGTETIDSDLSASFQIEHRFAPDTGEQAADLFWQGRSYLQLGSKKYGALYAGREYAPAYNIAVTSDPFAWNGIASVGGAAGWAGYTVDDNVSGAVRTSNTVGYKSPSLYNFTVNVASGLGEGSQGRHDGINVEYRSGKWYAGAAHDRTVGGTLRDNTDLTNAAVHYDFGSVKVMGYYALAHTGPNGVNANRQASIGALIPAGRGVVKAVYYNLDPEGNDNTKQKIGIGYEHFLSKRTSLYASAGFAVAGGKTDSTTGNTGVKHTF